ncbi:YceI family protein [Nonomuraea sp. NPDC050783]|uniref:YceI family protein n=1 Tax=Nonomuraea sp. NPDC050783 TaxID=3154634 RepID=UPI0034669C7C
MTVSDDSTMPGDLPGDLTGDYVLDPARSRIGFVARHTIGPEVRGRFDAFEGGAHLDGADPSRSRVELTIQAGSIRTGNPRRDAHLRGKYLALGSHPVITFTSGQVRRTGGTAFALTGDLTMRGVTRPVTVDLELAGVEPGPASGPRVLFTGRATIDRKDWGVNWSAAAGLVSRTVTLELDVAAIRRPPPPGR